MAVEISGQDPVKVKSSLAPFRLQRWATSYSAQFLSTTHHLTPVYLESLKLHHHHPPPRHPVLFPSSRICRPGTHRASHFISLSFLCLKCLVLIQIIHTCPWRLSLDNVCMASSPRQPRCFSPGWGGGVWFTSQSLGMAPCGDAVCSLLDCAWSAHTLSTSPPLLCPLVASWGNFLSLCFNRLQEVFPPRPRVPWGGVWALLPFFQYLTGTHVSSGSRRELERCLFQWLFLVYQLSNRWLTV